MQNKPDPAWQPQPQAAEKSPNMRLGLIGMAACVLMAGAGLHFYGGSKTQSNPTIAAESAGGDESQRIGLPLNVIAPQNAEQALAGSSFSAQQRADILAAVKRRDVRLVAMPVYDATGAGGMITLVCGPWQQTVGLTPKPTTVILPISMSGNVDIIPSAPPGPTGVGSGAITVFGPQALPVLYKQGDTLALTVIAQ
ncbi:hypothetical protein GOB86_07035 [Acetobacter lambici]|uniref:Uncharacterized protein n=1 Tax=Acetobacter lambici TaxID=1332824 RepID=A0ABT1EZS5_9PROT|nr:hypothetical protein [Acetobacter lambici]MCP1242338.1 hypothetical protein [Acetobacter lambici]MCP1258454.1 hypothetical protein [Acetobacter lambici]NHO56820.1 hypothetical protein [Acetobacter lambici]